ncbi:MAG: RelA/SpoT family protein [Nitrospinota bacterium]
MIRAEFIVEELKKNFPDADIDMFWRAYTFAARCHKGQKRVSGEPYLSHPLEVSYILAKMKLGHVSVSVGLLHDTLEDTLATRDEVKEHFGDDVLQIVDGVTKLSKIESTSAIENQASNIRKMMLAMSKDIRVILVKLADRVHNVRTLKHLSPAKQKKIAQETLDIYAPLANRLGINWMKVELEDGAFRYLNPIEYKKIKNKVGDLEEVTDRYIKKIVKSLQMELEKEIPNVKVYGRSKHYYSIMRKMRDRKMLFDEIHDLLGVRIITPLEDQCYKALGIIHSIFKPIPGKLKDYIALPKDNMYRSLHTTVLGEGGNKVEAQIRSERMNVFCEEGIAAHWRYKEGGSEDKKHDEQINWLRRLLEWQTEVKDPKEFLERVKIDLFPDEVYVFTPKEEVRSLMKGATPIDFAYAIHTDIGQSCIGAKINGKLSSIKRQLHNGDIVEILTSSHSHPSRDWLKYVVTPKAKAKITAYFRQAEAAQALKLGNDLIKNYLSEHNIDPKSLTNNRFIEDLAKDRGYNNIDSLMIAIGFGKITVAHLFQKSRLATVTDPNSKKLADKINSNKNRDLGSSKKSSSGVIVGGISDMLVRFARCCGPVPGEEIVGFISMGQGLLVHSVECRNAKNLGLDSERRVDVIWDLKEAQKTSVTLMIESRDKPGILAKISSIISINDSNIRRADISTDNVATGRMLVTMEVDSIDQLINIINELQRDNDIVSVERTIYGSNKLLRSNQFKNLKKRGL